MSATRLTRVFVSAACVLVVSAAAVFFWWTRQRKITDRELLLEAWQDWNVAGAVSDGTDGQIFEQLATQGYYDDARNLMRPSRDFPYFIVRLAEIRGKNGDIQGARRMLLELGVGELRNQAAEAVAMVQANSGDLTGALATIGPQGDRSRIIEQYGRHQSRAGDLEGALTTQERKPSCSFDDNPACGCEGIELQPDSCEKAGISADQGKFAEAWNLINRKNCDIRSYVANKQYGSDPVTAERELLKATDRLDLATGLNELATQAASKGNISDAVRLAGRAAQTSGSYDRDVIHDIAREWTQRSNPRTVRKWARSLSDLGLRSWALIGIAEALGHERTHLSVPPSPQGKPT